MILIAKWSLLSSTVTYVVLVLCFLHYAYVTVPEKRDLNEASIILQLKNVCHIETNVNLTLDWTRLCSYCNVHFVALIEEEMKLCISHFY